MGGVVLVHDDSNRINWKLGVIGELLTGKGGVTSAVNIRTRQGMTSRHIIKLYPIEVSSDEPQLKKTSVDSRDTISPTNIHECNL